MRIKALTLRIIKQIINDKRTIALVLFAPILILTLMYFIINYDNTTYSIGIINAPEDFIDALENNEDYTINIIKIDKTQVENEIKNDNIIAALDFSEDLSTINIDINGSNATDAKKVLSIIKSYNMINLQSKLHMQKVNFTEENYNTNYIYGNEDSSSFDNFGAPLIGIIVFFFVFLIAGINFLTERTSGTLEKLLSTPIKRSEIIIGYVLGFSILAILQTALITFFVVYVLNLRVVGNIIYVFLICLLTAISALTLGILLSTLANSEFQVMQFIPIVILPQTLLCGLFPLSEGWSIIGHAMPLYYTSNALTEVMIKGTGFSAISFDCLILILFSTFFMILNAQLLRKQRSV